ncbi:MAG: hypothetical protein AB8G11_22985 [Saprospiraceae bacterium]
MFKNKLHLGTIFGITLLAPIILITSLVIAELKYDDVMIEEILIFLIFLALFIICAVGMFTKKVWALRLTSFMLTAGLVLCLLGMFLEENDFIDIEMLGLFLMVCLFVFGSITLLNNNIVLEQFGVQETYDDLDDILDTDEY